MVPTTDAHTKKKNHHPSYYDHVDIYAAKEVQQIKLKKRGVLYFQYPAMHHHVFELTIHTQASMSTKEKPGPEGCES
jgi:hypothetical protein